MGVYRKVSISKSGLFQAQQLGVQKIMQTIFSSIVGLCLTVFLIGMTWQWLLKPLLKYPLILLKGALGKTYLAGVSVGNKIAEIKPKSVILPEGEMNEATAFMDQFAMPQYEIARWVKSYYIKKCGYVLFRGYANHVERCLVVDGNPVFQKKQGKRIRLSQVEGMYSRTDESFLNGTVEEVTKLFADSVSKIESPAPIKVKAKQLVIAEVEKPAVQTTQAVVAAEQAPKAEIPSAKPQKPLETYKGYLISYGKAIRHISSNKSSENGEESGREIEQFRVVIRDEEGVEESIWGQDLLRAMKDANVIVNDMVEVIKTGKRQIGTSWKNLYAMNKLA